MIYGKNHRQAEPLFPILKSKEDYKIRKLGWIMMAGWSLILVLILSWNLSQLKTNIHELAKITLRMSAEKDLTLRKWATGHGGVYVPVTHETPPNPYLEQVPERDITTPTGRPLTLLNPAYITRQVHTLGLEEYGVYGRLTSLNPINPVNAADPWEAEALKSFTPEIDEISEVKEFNDELFIRLIRPFYAEEGCLKCHRQQNFNVGDLRGGISVATPMEPYMALMRTKQFPLVGGYALIWIMGLGLIMWVTCRLEISTWDLGESEARYKTIVENANDAIYIHDFNGKIIDLNENACKMLGYEREGLLGNNLSKIDSLENTRNSAGRMKQLLQDNSIVFEGGHVHKNGSLIPVEISAKVISRDGEGLIQGFVRNITERKQAEEKIRYMSFHDNLTGLYNRAFLDQEMERLDTKRQLPISIIMADLNGLKLVNDVYGHSAGDEMLILAADVLKKSCREEDIIARWGGDEFVVLLPQTSNREARVICERITEEYSKKFVKEVPLSMALGVETKDSEDEDMIDILKSSENKMYKDKLANSRKVRGTVLNGLLRSLEDKSYETKEHAHRLRNVALKVGEKMNLPETELNRLALLAILHDIGKVTIAEEILKKEGPLTKNERKTLKKHPETGYQIVRSAQEFAHIAEDIIAHHEHWDGSGYPNRLRGKEIPLLARIINIADAYEEMTRGRPYKKSLSPQDAVAELKSSAGSQFDPELVEVVVGLMEEEEMS